MTYRPMDDAVSLYTAKKRVIKYMITMKKYFISPIIVDIGLGIEQSDSDIKILEYTSYRGKGLPRRP